LAFGSEGFVAAIGGVVFSFGWCAVAASGCVHGLGTVLGAVHGLGSVHGTVLGSVHGFVAATLSTTATLCVITLWWPIFILSIHVFTIFNSTIGSLLWWLLLAIVLSLITRVLKTGVSTWHAIFGTFALAFTF
jgi:hypothetical protein